MQDLYNDSLHIRVYRPTECLKLMYTLFETLFLSNEMRQIQFLLRTIQKAL